MSEPVRTQFTGWDTLHSPEINNEFYLDYVVVQTSLSRETCSYGYQIRTPSDQGPGAYTVEWLKKTDPRHPDNIKHIPPPSRNEQGGVKL